MLTRKNEYTNGKVGFQKNEAWVFKITKKKRSLI